MSGFAGKRYWIVGASDGLGAALARRLSAAGAEVILSARSEAKLQALAEDLPARADVQPMDVSDAAAVQAVAQDLGEIDGMIYAAGLYWPMRAQDLAAQEAIAMADVNFTGLLRVLGQVLHPMVARDRGHIVIIGSLSGFRGLPGAVGYAASKAGVMALAEALAVDLYRTGIKVQLVNPGFIKTRLTDKNDFRMPFLMDPERAAEITLRHMQGGRFQRNFPTGFSWVFRLSRLLPDWAYHRILAQR